MSRRHPFAGYSWALICVSAIVSSVGLSSAAADEKIQLGLRLKQGETYKTRYSMEQKMKQTFQGQAIDMTNSMEFVYSFKVEKVEDDGSMICKQNHESVMMKQDGPQGKTEYDSAKPPATVPPEAKPLAVLIGHGLTLHLTKEGKVNSVKGVEELYSKISDAIDVPNAAAKETLQKQFKEQFGEDAQKEQMEQLFAIFPDKPVGIGDTWSKRIVLSKGFPMILENTYTLKSRKDGIATVEIATKLETNPDGKPLKMGQMTMTPSLTGDQKGEKEIDEATGWTISSTLTQKFGGTLKMEGLPGLNEPLNIPISAESKVRMEQVK